MIEGIVSGKIALGIILMESDWSLVQHPQYLSSG